MDLLMKLLNLDLTAYLGAATALLSALYTVALMIPGKQPDKAIKSLLKMTEKLSRK